jgi:hypothetical protein
VTLFLPTYKREVAQISLRRMCHLGPGEDTFKETSNFLETSALEDLSTTTDEIGCSEATIEIMFTAMAIRH